jgi:hypothetical protein
MQNHIDILLISNNLDPSAWARKYFTAASVSWNFLDLNIIGINLNKFSSNAIHRNSQLDLEIAIKVLKIINDVIRVINGDINVSIKTWWS